MINFFNHKYPYTDNEELNLDWVIEEINKIKTASGIEYDDSNTQLNVTNVQEAIEALDALILQIASQSQKVSVIENQIPEAYWTGGHTFTHIQTVNDPTCMAIIEALRNDRIVILKRNMVPGIDLRYDYFIENEITNHTADYQHDVIFMNLLRTTHSSILINALNDDQNIQLIINADSTYTTVNSFNGRSGVVTAQASDYNANQVDYDNTGTGLTATDVQTAIDEVDGKIPATIVESFNTRSGAVTPQASDYDANQVDYDNTGSGLTATDVQAAIDEVKGMIPAPGSIDAEDVLYDNTQSGLAATDVQAALDEIANDVLSSGVASFNTRTGAVTAQAGDYDADQVDYDNTVSGLTATDVQAAIDEVDGKINGSNLKYLGNYEIRITGDGIKTLGDMLDDLHSALSTYVASKGAGYRFRITFLSPCVGNVPNGLGQDTRLYTTVPSEYFGGIIANTGIISLQMRSSSSAVYWIPFSPYAYNDITANLSTNGSDGILTLEEYEIV